ncbi:MFS transporter [Nonomuraea sp. NPDC050556]|uniref:MFS transporter n=1 Tax=Nonomuraea sp. NPDC050556 TaxID=3364369 RepID=UPI0037899CF2
MGGIWILRVARAAVFAVVCLALASLAHLLGGGMVHADALAIGLAITFGAGFWLAWRERSLRLILPVLALTQGGLHLLFGAMCPVEVASLSTHHGSPGVGMFLAHGWAIVMTALWLARGERALWALLRQGLRLLVVLFHTLVEPWPPYWPVQARTFPMPLRHVVVRRGPPLLIVAVRNQAG